MCRCPHYACCTLRSLGGRFWDVKALAIVKKEVFVRDLVWMKKTHNRLLGSCLPAVGGVILSNIPVVATPIPGGAGNEAAVAGVDGDKAVVGVDGVGSSCCATVLNVTAMADMAATVDMAGMIEEAGMDDNGREVNSVGWTAGFVDEVRVEATVIGVVVGANGNGTSVGLRCDVVAESNFCSDCGAGASLLPVTDGVG